MPDGTIEAWRDFPRLTRYQLSIFSKLSVILHTSFLL